MAVIELDLDRFRASFMVFSDPLMFIDGLIESKWTSATCIISPEDTGCFLNTKQRARVLDLMTAHLLQIDGMIYSGKNVVFVQGATIDKVNVSVTPPVATNQFNLWLSTTPYGQELRTILKSSTAGGIYANGLPERRAFRKVGGTFS